MLNKCLLVDINEQISDSIDLFICMASFESRCLSIPRSIECSKVKNAVVFYMKDSIEYIQENKKILEEHFGNNAKVIELAHSDPLFTADHMQEVLLEYARNSEPGSVTVDITTFTHESLLILLRLLHVVFPLTSITYMYANAQEYDSENEKESKWLSKGVGEVRSVLGYPGEILPNQKTHLVVIVGYEYERAASIINTLEPSKLSLAFGRSENATTDTDKAADEHYTQLVEQMASSYKDIERFEVKCNNPFETRDIINSHLISSGDMNNVVVALNNKMSTLGVAFVAMDNPAIQLSYAPALTYNYANYSSPGDSCYVIRE